MSHARRGLRDITNAVVDAKPAKRGLRDITNTAVDAKPAKRGLRDVTNQPHPDKPRKRLSPAAACENRDAAPTVYCTQCLLERLLLASRYVVLHSPAARSRTVPAADTAARG